ncbi:MAG TPA: hypothetical protein VIL85_13715 [Thermomicrobiales bacterium]|jgi:hypothetical protein
MSTITCTLGTDPEDATLNRPVAILHQPEFEALLAVAAAGGLPTFASLLGVVGEERRTFGMSELPRLRAELGAALTAISASRLPDSLIMALTLQRLDSACWTALELGLNLYVVVERVDE